MQPAVAMEKTGGAAWIATNLVSAVQWIPLELRPWVLLSVIYLFTNTFTEFLSNNAVAVLVTPIVISAAHSLGVEPRPYIIAVAIAASASFATPVGYQTNTLVYGAGGYMFRDFLKVGAPLNILFWILASLLIPFFWPLH